MRIVVCGGHHTSALLVAEALKGKGHQVYWFGHKYSMIGDKKPGAEYLEVTEKNIPFIEIKAGKWQPKYRFFPNLFRFPLGFGQSFFWLLRIKPNIIVSFGGYLALPVAFCGWVLGIPVVTHEQTVISGLANKAIALIAKKIFVSFKSSLKYFSSQKVVFTGLPLRPSLFVEGKKLFENNRKTIYITGGKQGAHLINKVVFGILPELLKKFNVIHQCGSTSLFNDIQTAEQIKCSFGEMGKNYLVREYFFDSEIGNVFYSSDFVISRAGAHTVYELMSLGKPAVLIPIPWSNRNEQMLNAKMLSEAGLAKIVEQEKVEKGELLNEILEFADNLSKFRLKNKENQVTNANEIIVQEIEKLLVAP